MHRLSVCLQPCAAFGSICNTKPHWKFQKHKLQSLCLLTVDFPLSLTPAGWNVSWVAGSLLTKGLDDCFGNPSLYWNLIKTTHQTQGGGIGSLNDAFFKEKIVICASKSNKRKNLVIQKWKKKCFSFVTLLISFLSSKLFDGLSLLQE